MSILETVNLSYSYDGRRKILRDLSVSFEAGKIYAILGPSGCGKTTLLSLLGGLDAPMPEAFFLTEQISGKKALPATGNITFPSSFRLIISLII